MDQKKFQDWCASNKVHQAVADVILKSVSGKKPLEEIMDTMMENPEGVSTSSLIVALSRPKGGDGKPLCDLKAIMDVYRQHNNAAPGSVGAAIGNQAPRPTPEPVFASAATSEKPAPKKSFPGLGGILGGGKSGQSKSMGMGPKMGRPSSTKKSGKLYLIIGAVVVLVLLGLVGFFVLGSGQNGPSDYTPGNSTTTTQPQATKAPQLDENGKPVQWFVVKQEKLDTTEPFLVKPPTFIEFIKKVPWRWLLWIVFFVPMFSLLAKDRFSSGERTDIGTVVLGLTFLLATVLLTEPIGVMVTWISHEIGSPIEAPAVWINLIGVLVNLGVQWSATSSGKRDYSAFAIAGLFATGAILIWWNPTVTITVIIGALFMLGGLLLQAHEMGRSHQGGQAVFVAMMMLGVFAVTMVIWQVFCWGVSYIPQPDNVLAAKVLGFVAWGLVSSKTWMSGIIAILVVLGTGDMIASAIMPPKRPTSRQADSYPDQNDREKRQEIDSRFDAMVFAIMLLYPIAVIIWEAIRVFGVI